MTDLPPPDPGPGRRRGTDGVTVRRPGVDGVLGALLATLDRAGIGGEDPLLPLRVEVWADRASASLFERDEMGPRLWAELAEGLRAAAHPLAPAVLAALATVVEAERATPLRRAAEAARRADPEDPALAIGTARRVALSHRDLGDGGVEVLAEVHQLGCDHSAGLVVAEGEIVDAFLSGPGGAREGIAEGPDATREDPAARAVLRDLDLSPLAPETLDDAGRAVWPAVARRLRDAPT